MFFIDAFFEKAVATTTITTTAAATPQAAKISPKSTILVVGDSLSAAYGLNPDQGWVTLLEKKLEAENLPYKVVNISVTGDTTSNGLEKLPTALQQYHPQIVILGLGSNDGLRGLTISALKKNLNRMVELSQKAKAKVLLVGFLIPPNYGPIYSKQFEQAYVEVADKYHLQRVPFLLANIALNPELMQEDGLHPNLAAQPVILENIWPYLKATIK